MKRTAYHIVCAFSLFLALVAAAGWLLSYLRPSTHLLKGDMHRTVVFGRTLESTPGGTVSRSQDRSAPKSYWRSWYFVNRAGRVYLFHQDVNLGLAGAVTVQAPNVLRVLESHVQFENQARPLVESQQPVRVVLPDPAQVPQRARDRRARNILVEVGFARDAVAWQAKVAGGTSGSITVTMLPHWLFMLIGLPLPLLWLKRYLRQRYWAGLGRCLNCGYDLRESPERCPECGTPIPAEAKPGTDCLAGNSPAPPWPSRDG
jgi:hypothetical protein